PRPVPPDHAEYLRPVQGSAEPLDQRAGPDSHAHVPGRHHLIAAPLGYFESERHRAIGANHRAEAGQAIEALAPALGLAAVLPRDVAGDVILLARDEALLLIEGPLLS